LRPLGRVRISIDAQRRCPCRAQADLPCPWPYRSNGPVDVRCVVPTAGPGQSIATAPDGTERIRARGPRALGRAAPLRVEWPNRPKPTAQTSRSSTTIRPVPKNELNRVLGDLGQRPPGTAPVAFGSTRGVVNREVWAVGFRGLAVAPPRGLRRLARWNLTPAATIGQPSPAAQQARVAAPRPRYCPTQRPQLRPFTTPRREPKATKAAACAPDWVPRPLSAASVHWPNGCR